MNIEHLNRVIGLVKNYIRLLDEEYSIISDISELIYLMKQCPNVERIRKSYIEKQEQIGKLREKSHRFIIAIENWISLFSCASAESDYSIGIDILEKAQQRIREKESFISALDSFELIDDDVVSVIEDAKTVTKDITESISETSLNMLMTEQEKSELRRKQLADALKKGEPVTISPEGKISDLSRLYVKSGGLRNS